MGIKGIIIAVVLTGTPAWAASAARRPEARELLSAALAPSGALRARVRVQVFGPAGKAGKAKGQTREVSAGADGSFRVEVAGKRPGAMSLLAVADGRALLTAWPTQGRGWLGAVPPANAAAERARLDALYEVSVATGGRGAKNSLWRLDFLSKADGRLRRSWWLSKDSRVVLKREDYRPDGTLMRRERTRRLEEPRFTAAQFRVAAPDGVAVDAATAPFVAGPAPAFAPRFPAWLPVGFVPLRITGTGAGALVVFTDGLTTLTLAEGPAGSGAREPEPYARVPLNAGEGRFSFQDGAIRLAWSAGGRDYAASADLPEAELARVAASVPGAP